MTPVVLAIETSQRAGGVALADRAGAVYVEALSGEDRHDDALMPAIARACSRAALAPSDLRAVAVSIGPGGFTGIRLAVVTAKMMSLSLGVELIAVPTAEIVATGTCTPDDPDDVLVVLSAKRESFWCAHLRRSDDRYIMHEDFGIRTSETVELAGIGLVLADAYAPATLRARAEASGRVVRTPICDPRACLRVAMPMQAAGDFTTATALAPWYPRPPEAVTLWEQRHGPRGHVQ
ncbi:MAG: tRNA (adenosine(37)-N6)-threonylcarbamoyltransferase complex dimerization subunit type 1 TsaB [Phycisphaerales bacterium]|nr:tRNA (adenosine(37)-N6)-threonylcarbamoyltransferase complex dimerization subunit type 1 TsaB [Phycisphaerales bacterium]